MTEKSFNIKRSDGKKIPVWLGLLEPFEVADTVTITRKVRGKDIIDTLTLKHAVFTGHIVVLDDEERILAVVKTLPEFLDALEKIITQCYDGDLVEEIRIIIARKTNVK
jgi:hypothetical protein